MDYNQKSLKLHEELKGKIEVISRVKVGDAESLATAYTPGVAAPTLEISKNPENSYVYTRRGNLVAVVSDGSAILGLGNLGGLSAMPVMEGKCILFKEFGGVDAIPLCIRGCIYTVGIFAVEFISGSFFRLLHICPWDYSRAPLNYKGLIRLDYAPLWFAAGIFFEKILGKLS